MTRYTKTEDGELIGHKMVSALKILNSAGGVMRSRLPLAEAVGPHGSSQYGYQTVNRCRSKGLVKVDPDHDDANPRGTGAVVLTEKGRRFVESQK